MPLFGGGSALEQEIEKATQETVVKEDVSVMFEICDRVKTTPDGCKEAYRCLVRRMQNANPRVALMTLTLLDICVMNCGKKFHLEICSRDFTTQCKALLGKAHPKVQDKLKFLLVKWATNEFKADPQLALIENFIQKCKMEGVSFDLQEPTLDTLDVKPQQRGPAQQHQRQEEDDLAKAIELSLQETKMKEDYASSGASNGNSGGGGLYPSIIKALSATSSAVGNGISSGVSHSSAAGGSSASKSASESRKVRALYDFEAAEENELSFKAGEIIIVLEDRDQNWWKGSNHRGDGLFPSNFVTSNLEATGPEEEAGGSAANLTTAQEVVQMPTAAQVTHVDESKMDALLQMLHDADPTALQRTETDARMETLEAECSMMNPLIDAELEKIDRKHASLSMLSRRLTDALNMYHHQLRQLPQMPFNPPVVMPPGLHQMPPPHMQGYYLPQQQQVPQVAAAPGMPGYPPTMLHGQMMPPQMAPSGQMMGVPPGQPPVHHPGMGAVAAQPPPPMMQAPPHMMMPPYVYHQQMAMHHPAMANGVAPPPMVNGMPHHPDGGVAPPANQPPQPAGQQAAAN